MKMFAPLACEPPHPACGHPLPQRGRGKAKSALKTCARVRNPLPHRGRGQGEGALARFHGFQTTTKRTDIKFSGGAR